MAAKLGSTANAPELLARPISRSLSLGHPSPEAPQIPREGGKHGCSFSGSRHSALRSEQAVLRHRRCAGGTAVGSAGGAGRRGAAGRVWSWHVGGVTGWRAALGCGEPYSSAASCVLLCHPPTGTVTNGGRGREHPVSLSAESPRSRSRRCVLGCVLRIAPYQEPLQAKPPLEQEAERRVGPATPRNQTPLCMGMDPLRASDDRHSLTQARDMRQPNRNKVTVGHDMTIHDMQQYDHMVTCDNMTIF